MEAEKEDDKSQEMNTVGNQVEFSKLQGFDVLEKLPDERMESTYNQEFYNSLSNLKFLSITIPEENKLFYHFEQNKNASVSTTTGQILKTYEDLFMQELSIKKIMKYIKKDVVGIFSNYESFDDTIIGMVKPEIEEMEKRLQNYLVEQKTENFKLIKEIAILEREKDKLKNSIEDALTRLEKLEKVVGKNSNKNNSLSKEGSVPYNTGNTSLGVNVNTLSAGRP
ncbi:MAG: hypothetical protein MJ252_19855 [archaeon]|nr:hypothetical protein [archaeon]